MRKSFLINEEMCKYFTIYEEAVSHILSVTDPVFQGSNLSNRYEDDR